MDVKKGLANPRKQVERVIAVGQQAVYPALAETGDCDNGFGIVEFSNGKILTTHLGRTLSNGYEATTRLNGTKGHTVINGDCRINGVQIRDKYGVRTLSTQDAFQLHGKSFINDLVEFANAVLDGTTMSCAPEDALEAAKIGMALQHSFRSRLPVYFDEEGSPIIEQTTDMSHIANGVKATNGVHDLKVSNDIVTY